MLTQGDWPDSKVFAALPCGWLVVARRSAWSVCILSKVAMPCGTYRCKQATRTPR